jgi:parallel beta-helix repeat protein
MSWYGMAEWGEVNRRVKFDPKKRFFVDWRRGRGGRPLHPIKKRGNQVYVDGQFTGTSDGSFPNPYKTIQAGVDVLEAGDTIWIKGYSGYEYDEQVQITVSGEINKPITFKPWNAKVVIDGDWGGASPKPVPRELGLLDISADYVVIDGLDLGIEVRDSRGDCLRLNGDNNKAKNVLTDTCYNVGIKVLGDGNRVEECTVTQATWGTYLGLKASWEPGIVCYRADNNVIINNTVYNNYGEGIAIVQSGDCEVESNVCYDNRRANIYLDNAWDSIADSNYVYMSGHSTLWWPTTAAPPQGIMVADEGYVGVPDALGKRRTVRNNIVIGCRPNFHYWWDPLVGTVGNHADAGLIDDLIVHNTLCNGQGKVPLNVAIENNTTKGDNHSGTTFANNIIYQADAELNMYLEATSGINFDYNCWSSTCDSSGAVGSNDLTTDPNFISVGSTDPVDYKLGSTSACINAGDDFSIDEDYFDNTRDATPDIGAYEY